MTERPICEVCHEDATLRVNGIYVCVKHADNASEQDQTEDDIEYLEEE